MKKIFTLKRVALLMSLILVYTCAFLFVKIYADKSILSASAMPSDDSLYVPSEPETVEEAFEEAKAQAPAFTGPVENIVNKVAGNRGIMGIASATSVPDSIETPETTKETEKTEATTPKTEAPTTKHSETTTEKTTAPTTAPPPTTTSEQPVEDSAPEENEEEYIDEQPEFDDDDAVLDDPEEETGEILPPGMTDEQLRELLERLGVEGAQLPQTNPSDALISAGSYKNQFLTIYDTKQKRLRTENAFDLVCEITSSEVGSSMEPEAIKAQAVAAYTYCKYYEQKGEYAEIATKSDVPDIVKQCVEAVDGLAIYYDGKYIMSAFSASTGGYTAASKNVWGGDLPYLQSVMNEYDYLDSKYYGCVTTYTVDEVRSKIESKTNIRLSENYSEWIRVLSHNDNIYVGQLSIDGHTSAYISGKERTITGHVFRTYILGIRSTAFTVSYSNGVFTFTTYGYGHGVGLSQIGANLYAKYGGYTFDQILHHYYTGVTIR